MIHLRWTAFDDANCDEFRIYRSIPGFILSFPLTVAGTDLKLQITSPDTQVISITSNDIPDFIDEFNAQAKGAIASLSDSGDKVLVRATATKNARIKILPCTFATAASLSPRIILPESEWTYIDAVSRVIDENSYDFEDADGQYVDSYRLTSVIGVYESIPSIITHPAIVLPAICVLEGRILSKSGTALSNALVRAKPYIMADGEDSAFLPPQNQFLTTRTDIYGRFTINLLQKHVYLLEIPAVGYNDIVEIPESEWGRVLSLTATSKHWFNPGSGDPI